jgi:ankyrin repeat protein
MSGLLGFASNGDLASVKRMLVEGKASISERDDDGCTALLLAAEDGHIELMAWLLKAGGASIAEVSNGGSPALLFAALRGHLDAVKWLLKEGGACVTEVNASGATALLAASVSGNVDLVRWLIEEGGASITECAANGNTALLMASIKGHFALMQYLLVDGGASIFESNFAGETVWGRLKLEDADDAELVSLLKVMTLLDDAPAQFINNLPSRHLVRIVNEGRQLRAQLPIYLVQQEARVIKHCPLPNVLQALVVAYAAPTREDIWSTAGLRARTPSQYFGRWMRRMFCFFRSEKS